MRFPLLFRRLFVLAALVGAVGGGAATPLAAAAQGRASEDPAGVLRAIIASRRHRVQRWPRLDDVAADLQRAYTRAAWAPLWLRDGQPTPAALAVIAELERVTARGLDPRDYDAGALRTRAARLAVLPVWTATAAAAAALDTAQAAFDVMLSTASLRVLHALQHGRVSPGVIHPSLRLSHEPWDAVDALGELAASTDAVGLFDAAEPPYAHYRALKAVLVRFRALEDDTVRLRAVLRDSTRTSHTPEGLPVLRRRLAARLRTLELSLERWRWLPHRFSAPPIIVNIPAFRLYAFTDVQDRPQEVLAMDVVVGQAYDHKTPVFSDVMQYLVFSPYWDVPPSIARKELLPKARRDPEYLPRNEYEIVTDDEQVLPHGASSIAAVAAGRARIRQRPGAKNALGGVKFIFPNAFNVYMHDTPTTSVFAQARRDLSHGCIRLAEPARLAALVLRGQAGWDSTRIATDMHREMPLRVPLATPVPVHILYVTAMAQPDGRVTFYDDLYHHDRTLDRELARGYPYRTR
ncbi:MAG: L,D-transpeptidase family protein [Gemmatimonadota bacterium]|nr:L,D-transpeptidase family protein [Gemmatimonadota bacterium]